MSHPAANGVTPLSRPKTLVQLDTAKFLLNDKLEVLTEISEVRDGLSIKDLNDQLINITKKFDRVPMKDMMITLLVDGRIKVIGNRETVRVPAALSNWRVMGTNGLPVTLVNISPYLPSTGVNSVDVRKLFGLLIGGAISLKGYENWSSIKASRVIVENGVLIYTRMMYKVLDRMISLGTDEFRSNKIKFVFAKYFLINLTQKIPSLDLDKFVIEKVAKNATLSAVQEFEFSMSQAGEASINQMEMYNLSLLKFLEKMKEAEPWTNRMTVRGFLQNLAQMYGAPSLLMAEDLLYFLQGIAYHNLGSEIISSYTFNTVALTLDEAIYNELGVILNKKSSS
jgi:hypothetical protein